MQPIYETTLKIIARAYGQNQIELEDAVLLGLKVEIPARREDYNEVYYKGNKDNSPEAVYEVLPEAKAQEFLDALNDALIDETH